MPDETGANIVSDGEEARADLEGVQEHVGRPDERGDSPQLRSLGDANRLSVHAEVNSVDSSRAESLTAATSAAPGSVAEALQAAAEQIERERGDSARDQAALVQALRTFLETFAGQNAPTRSEFRDLAARLDRLSSQFAKGR